jgi:hypothetical protein
MCKLLVEINIYHHKQLFLGKYIELEWWRSTVIVGRWWSSIDYFGSIRSRYRLGALSYSDWTWCKYIQCVLFAMHRFESGDNECYLDYWQQLHRLFRVLPMVQLYWQICTDLNRHSIRFTIVNILPHCNWLQSIAIRTHFYAVPTIVAYDGTIGESKHHVQHVSM